MLSAEKRETILRTIARAEQGAPYVEGFNIRDQVTGPVADLLFEPGETITKTLHDGVKLTFRYTSKIAREFAMAWDEHPDHAWEPQTTKLLCKIASRGGNALVGGAYFGDQAILIAQAVGSTGKVYCFDLDNIDLIELNARQNGLTNVVAEKLGLWDQAGIRMKLSGGQDSHATSAPDPEGSFVTTSIDRYGEEHEIDRLNLIMLDIEGLEFIALTGAKRYLAMPAGDAPDIVFEVHGAYMDWSNGLRQTDLLKFMEGYGYSHFAIRDYQANVPMRGKPIELIPVDDAYIGGPTHGFNVLATKRPEQYSAPDFAIVRGVSPKLLFHRDPTLHSPL